MIFMTERLIIVLTVAQRWMNDMVEQERISDKTTRNDSDKARIFYCDRCHYAVSDIFEGAEGGAECVLCFEKGKDWSYCPNCGTRIEQSERKPIPGQERPISEFWNGSEK